jgi:hypothetical protein
MREFFSGHALSAKGNADEVRDLGRKQWGMELYLTSYHDNNVKGDGHEGSRIGGSQGDG